MTRTLRSFAFGGLVLLAACATPNVEKSYMLSSASGKGVAVGSITSSTPFAEYRLFYRRRGGDGEGYFKLQSDNPALNAALIAAELPAGDYEIYKWLVVWPSYYGIYEISPLAQPSIPFRVEPGRAVYFGSCEFALRAVYRSDNVVGADVQCTNEFERDLMELASRYPTVSNAVSSTHVEKALLYRSTESKRRNVTLVGE